MSATAPRSPRTARASVHPRRAHPRTSLAVAGVGLIALAAPVAASAATATVVVGGGDMKAGIMLTANYPAVTTIHQGDKVRFVFAGFHTVTFLGKGAKLPSLVTLLGPVPAANDAAGQPFWWAGRRGVGLDPRGLIPSGGTAVRRGRTVNTGFPHTPKPVTLSFPETGTFVFRCVQHPLMRGVIRVVPKEAAITPLNAQMGAGMARQRADIVAAKKKVARATAMLARKGATVDVGYGDRTFDAESMLPRTVTVGAGTTVTFRFPDAQETHTVTFGPDALIDGFVKAFEAAGPGVSAPPEVLYASDAPGAMPVVYTGTNHGNGFLNSGIAGAAPAPSPKTWRVTFTTPGSYTYVCIIHGRMMSGTIVVTA